LQHRRAFGSAQLVRGFRARHEGPLIGVKLAVFRPAPQSAIADLQLEAGFGTPRASGDGVVDQNNCGLAIWGADHASSFGASDCAPDGLILRRRTASHPPQIAEAFFRRTRSAAVSANARSLRASSRSRSLTRFFSSLVA